jgi:hypothetical protein
LWFITIHSRASNQADAAIAEPVPLAGEVAQRHLISGQSGTRSRRTVLGSTLAS